MQPYAFGTLVLNQDCKTTQVAARRLKFATKQIALRLDQEFLKTRHATRFPRFQRFEAVCFYEKLEGHPHIHLAFFSPSECAKSSEISRIRFLASRFASEPTRSMYSGSEPASIETSREDIIELTIPQCVHSSLTSHIVEVDDSFGLAKYITKCYNNSTFEPFWLSEFHSFRA